MQTISFQKTHLMIMIAIAALAMLFLPQSAQAAISTTRAIVKCSGETSVCNGTGSVGKATTRGSLTSGSYTPRSTPFIFDTVKRASVILRVSVRLNCVSNLASSNQTIAVRKNFEKRKQIRAGRNLVIVSGRKLSCPSGFSTALSGSYIFYSADTSSGEDVFYGSAKLNAIH